MTGLNKYLVCISNFGSIISHISGNMSPTNTTADVDQHRVAMETRQFPHTLVQDLGCLVVYLEEGIGGDPERTAEQGFIQVR